MKDFVQSDKAWRARSVGPYPSDAACPTHAGHSTATSSCPQRGRYEPSSTARYAHPSPHDRPSSLDARPSAGASCGAHGALERHSTKEETWLLENADARGSAPVSSSSQNINISETHDNRFDSLDFYAIISGRMASSDVASLNTVPSRIHYINNYFERADM